MDRSDELVLDGMNGMDRSDELVLDGMNMMNRSDELELYGMNRIDRSDELGLDEISWRELNTRYCRFYCKFTLLHSSVHTC